MNKQLNIQTVSPEELTLIRALAAKPYSAPARRPIWLQVYDRLADACAHGPLRAGARLPGENDLAEMFSVSRLTMRKALSKLQQEGQLQARKGVGIFVRHRPTRYTIDDDLRFSQSLEASADRIETRTLELVRTEVSSEAAFALGLESGATVVCLTRLRVVDGEPIYLTKKEFPADRFPNFETIYAQNQSVMDVYRAHGVAQYTRAETRVTGGFASRDESHALQLSDRTPLLCVSSINVDPDGHPVEFTYGRWPLGSVELVFGPKQVRHQAPEG